MSDVIPSDVLEAAREAAAASYPDADQTIRAGLVDGLYMIPIIAIAIMAERDRCAKLAKSVQDRSDDYNGAYDGVQDAIDGINNS